MTTNIEGSSRQQIRVPLTLLALVLALTVAAFWPSLRGELVYDDLVVVARNPLITSFRHLPELFSSGMWDFLDAQDASRVGYWRPLASVGLSIGYQLGDGRPLVFHLLSLALHCAATAVALRLALRLSQSRAIACFAALLFALHPVHVESVAWISALNDPLFGLFALLSLDAFVAWRDRGSAGSASKAAIYLLLALLSKEMAITVVPIALAIDVARARVKGASRGVLQALQPLVGAYGPYFVAVAAYYLARVAVFGDLQAGFGLTTTDFGVPALRLSLLRVELLGGFLWLLAWPAHLQLFHPFQPEITLSDPSMARAVLSVIVFAAVLIGLWKRRVELLLTAALIVPAALVPPLVRVESLGTFPLSERFLYLAVIGFTLLVAGAAVRWLPQRVAFSLLALCALACGVRTFDRARTWSDEETLFRTAAAESPRSPYAQWGLGRVLLQKYRQERRVPVLADAHAAFQRALDLLAAAQAGNQKLFATRDDHLQANLGLAWTLLYESELSDYAQEETAYRVFQTIDERYPGHEEVATGLGVAALALGRIDDAQRHLSRALELNPRFVEAHHNLGVVRMKRGEWKSAAASFEEALRYRPGHLDDLLWLARALAQGGELERARGVLEQALALHPSDAGPRVLQATLLAQAGDLARARVLIEQALAIEPDNGEAWLLKGKLLLARDERTSARSALERASELAPASFEAHYNLGALLLSTDGPAAALPYLMRAYGVRPSDASGALLRETLVKLDIQDADTLWRLASLDAQRGLDANALEWLATLFARAPDHGPGHYLRGMLFKKRGEREAAARELDSACRAMAQSYQAHYELGMLLVELGRKDEGLERLDQALELARRSEGANEESQAALAALEAKIGEIRARQ